MAETAPHYAIPRRTGLTDAVALRDVARQADLSQGFRVDASGVEVVTTPLVTVLIVIDDALRLHGGALRLDAPSQPLVDAFTDLGLYSRLMAMEFGP